MGREKKDIASVLMPLHDVWVGEPDQRFGQLVANLVRGDLPLDILSFMSDEDFLALVKKHP
jgi:hypothetical protein